MWNVIWNTIIQVLESDVTSGLVNILALIIGAVGLFISIKTMNSAEKIQEEVATMKATAVNKSNFLINRYELSKSIDRIINRIQKEQIFSKKLYMEIFKIVTKVNSFENIFEESDYRKIDKLYSDLKIIGPKEEKYTDKDIQTFLQILIEIQAILMKGEYEV